MLGGFLAFGESASAPGLFDDLGHKVLETCSKRAVWEGFLSCPKFPHALGEIFGQSENSGSPVEKYSVNLKTIRRKFRDRPFRVMPW